MSNSKEYKEEYERKFNGYIMQIIKRQYWKYVKRKAKEENIISLNSISDDGIEIIDTLISKEEIIVRDFYDLKEIEMIMEDRKIYNAVKSLTNTEKLAIFLCFILELNRKEVAEIMHLKHAESVIRISKRAIKKIRDNLNRHGGGFND